MLRVWVAIAFLATSWLLGLGYYHQADPVAWVVVLGVGAAGLLRTVRTPAGRAACASSALLLLPALVRADWPWRASFVFMFVGLVLVTAPIPRRWPSILGTTLLSTGVVLLAQALAMLAYEGWTARSHELPQPVARLLAATLQWVGMNAGFAGDTVAVHSMRQVHPLGATWGLFLDPVTVCFLAGGTAMLFLLARAHPVPADRRRYLARSVGRLACCTLAWLPVRAALLVAFYMHRVLRLDYDASPELMDQFWSPWVHLVLLGGPVLLAWRFVRVPAPAPSLDEAVVGSKTVRWPAGVLAFVAAGLMTAGILWAPAGERKAGRVAVDEFHSSWEPTGRPFDTEWYGNESGYNYACIYDYCSRFYEMSRIAEPLSPAVLRDLDVLILKVPNLSAYAPAEIDAVRQFVERGGGLLLIGEHTDVFKTGTHLNDVARRFGFRFRSDCLFGVDKFFDQLYRPPLVPHPIVQQVSAVDFAVSCSIDPGGSRGRAAILGTGLKNLGADYHASNFYPQAVDRPEMRYGAFVQLWTTWAGAGRVAAFTDSTQFSNFCVFDPGKSELFVGMVEWLNRRSSLDGSAPLPLAAGVLLLIAAAWAARRREAGGIVLIASGALGWACSALTLSGIQAMPSPQAVRPMTRVVFDRTVSTAGLPKNGFVAGKEDEFGIFERWVLRLGYFTARADGNDAFKGDLLVFLYPSQSVTPRFREQLEAYVAGGGKVLVLDSLRNTASTANSLLYPFGLKVERSRPAEGEIAFTFGALPVPVEGACAVSGGEAIARIDEAPVAATVRHGQGSVTVLTFGSRFSDFNMGVTGDAIPDAELRKIYDVEFALLRAIVGGKLVSQPATAPADERAVEREGASTATAPDGPASSN